MRYHWIRVDTPAGPIWVEPGNEEVARALADRIGQDRTAAVPARGAGDPGRPAEPLTVRSVSYRRGEHTWVRC